MSDRATVLLALAAAAGVLVAHPSSIAAGAAVAVVAFAARRPLLLVLAVFLLGNSLGARAWDGLTPPATRPVDAIVVLVTDPKPVAGAVRAEVKLGRRRVEAWAHGAAAGALYHRLAGEVVRVSGTLRPVSGAARERLAVRHIAARLNVSTADYVSSGSVGARMANRLRRLLVEGARSMSREQRSLFTGFVLGDDREQPEEVTDQFRNAGLSHLLVVSGANVAFFIAMAAPLLRRLRLRSRLVAGAVLLGFFGVLTRWEPSVLRAIAMAGIVMFAATVGRPVSAIRVLSLAVAGLLLVDPMLVRSVGFLLSVGACAGIAMLARPIARRVPGPRLLADAVGVTTAAQVGVAPVLVPVFGPLPLAAMPANLLAVPAAAPIMVWGMTGGFVAGVLPSTLAAAVHVPTTVLVAWVAFVARVFADWPIARVGLLPLAVMSVTVVGWSRLRSTHAARHRRADI